MSKTLRRWFWVITFSCLPFLRRCLWQPHGEGSDCCRYYCWSCNQFSSDRPGYSSYTTNDYRELCESCWKRRRRWSCLYWLETGEQVTVQDIDGDGVISPSTTRSSKTFRVYRIFGLRFVSAKALEQSERNVKSAAYWFYKLQVHGNSEMIGKIKKWQEADLYD